MILSEEEIRSRMKCIIWDYDIDPYSLFEVVTGIKEKENDFDFEKVFLRMLERMSWYDLLDLLGVDFLQNNLTTAIIEKIRIKEMRQKYEYARKILQGEPVSVSGWSPEYREQIRHTLLSDRWYSSK